MATCWKLSGSLFSLFFWKGSLGPKLICESSRKRTGTWGFKGKILYKCVAHQLSHDRVHNGRSTELGVRVAVLIIIIIHPSEAAPFTHHHQNSSRILLDPNPQNYMYKQLISALEGGQQGCYHYTHENESAKACSDFNNALQQVCHIFSSRISLALETFSI